ncbi:MAG: hypothetical protein C0614_01195, partial [Desulfuromonas sp.]
MARQRDGKQKHQAKRKRNLLALEPRMMFDAAGLVSAVDAHLDSSLSSLPDQLDPVDQTLLDALTQLDTAHALPGDTAATDVGPEPATDSHPADDPATVSPLADQTDGYQFASATPLELQIRQASAASTSLIAEFLGNHSDAELFSLFNGGQETPVEGWNARLDLLREAANRDQLRFDVTPLASRDINGALAAYTSAGPSGAPTLFVNRDWFAMIDEAQMSRLIVEEYGHAIDQFLNQGSDTQGDEGELFAMSVLGEDPNSSFWARAQAEDDHGTLQLDGNNYQVEYATLNFQNAYRVNIATTPAGKESNSHDIIWNNLAIDSIIDDGTSNDLFSGNDVSVIGINIAGTTYYGWISRPVKDTGNVKGFYFWTDNDFVDLDTARADGNTDGDRDVTDNQAFILVVDQSYFDGEPVTGTVNISGTDYDLKNVGSSSDRADTSLNALITVDPVANPDTATAVEAGGVSNGTTGTNPTGNVLTDDTANNAKVVSKVGTQAADTSVASGSTSSSNPASITGKYGTLLIGADGSYQFNVDNSDPEVEALRSASDTLTDTFTYTMENDAGKTSTSTLTITIQGANDNPVANNDYNAVSGTAASLPSSPVSGNVLDNDTDVDEYGETKTIGSSTASATAVAVSNQVTVGVINNVDTPTNQINVGDLVYRHDSSQTPSYTTDTGATVTSTNIPKSNSNPLSGTYTIGLSTGINVSTGETLSFLASLSGQISQAYATVTSTSATASTSIGLSSIDGSITAGMTVSGTDSTGTAFTRTVSSVDYANNTVTVNSAVLVQNGSSLSFSKGLTGTETITGQYGTLSLDTVTGAYTYTPNSGLTAGTYSDTFNYTMNDAAGAQSSAVLTIRVEVFASPPTANADTATAVEAGGVSNGTAGTDPTGNVITGGTADTGSGTLTVTKAWSSSTATETTVASGTTITGRYGTLTISTDGSYSYAVNNANTTVDALHDSSETLTDTFYYRLNDGANNETDITTLTITIEGANDNPVATNDSAIAVETGGVLNATPGYNPSGNVLTNDTDVDDTAAELVVTAIRTGSTEGSGTAGTVGSALTGSYGSLTLNSSGTWTYTLDNSNATVEALAAGATLTESFNYTVTDSSNVSGLTDIAVLNITIQGANDSVGVNNLFVNEGVGYAQFTVTGVSGTSVSLALSDSAGLSSSDAKATLGTDTAAASPLEYSTDGGTNWTTYNASSPPAIPASTQLLVRIAITNDTVHEGNEAFTLAATANGVTVYGICTINDEGDGDGGTDDDRPEISITNSTVEEGINTVFTVSLSKTSTGEISFRPTLSNGTATIGTDTAASSALYYSTDSGSNWSLVTDASRGSASGSVIFSAGSSSIQLRLATTDDNLAESSETFTLATGYISGTVTNMAGVSGTGTITDNDPTLDLDTTDPATLNYAVTYTEGDSAIALATIAGDNLTDPDSTLFDRLAVSFTQSNFADGDKETLSLSGATGGSFNNLQNLTAGTGPFTLGGVGYTYTTTVSGGIATLSFALTSGADMNDTQAEALIDALRYQNTSDNPTESSSRVLSFTAYDDEGKSNSDVPATTTITVVAVNDPPESTDDTINATQNTAFILSASDFGTFSDKEGDSLTKVQITVLEDAGSLQYNSGSWTDVTAGQEITKADIDAGKLRFVPGTNETGTPYTNSIRFKVSDGTDYSTSAYTLTVNVSPAHLEPTLTATEAAVTFTEGDSSPADLFSSVAVSTIESGQTITRLDMTVTNVSDSASEKLNIDGTSISLTNGTTGTT